MQDILRQQDTKGPSHSALSYYVERMGLKNLRPIRDRRGRMQRCVAQRNSLLHQAERRANDSRKSRAAHCENQRNSCATLTSYRLAGILARSPRHRAKQGFLAVVIIPRPSQMENQKPRKCGVSARAYEPIRAKSESDLARIWHELDRLKYSDHQRLAA